MTKYRTKFICQSCGAEHPRWSGKCDICEGWNTLSEDIASRGGGIGGSPALSSKRKGKVVPLVTLSDDIDDAPRIASGIKELDRATGGGFVKGSVVLVGGDPGIGKSTLLIQTASCLAQTGHRVIYVSGEEGTTQVKLRAARLGLSETQVELAAETNVEDILATLSEGKKPDLVILDSIQTLWTDGIDSAPGTVSQLRTCAQIIIRYAKSYNVAIVFVGHVTKDGQIAGPRVIEHMVDTVLYFEGEDRYHYRVLRAVKNRFGPTYEIGIFEMHEKGLKEVSNPSELFLGERHNKTPGTAIFAGIEGTRPILVEIQALVSSSNLGMPRRAVVGWDSTRLSMILAVLETHCKIRFSSHDVYLNVSGGYRISEPAADLAVAAALISSLTGLALEPNCVYFGEIGLSGSVRSVPYASQRLKEAEKLGFGMTVLPKGSEEHGSQGVTLEILPIHKLTELIRNISKQEKK